MSDSHSETDEQDGEVIEGFDSVWVKQEIQYEEEEHLGEGTSSKCQNQVVPQELEDILHDEDEPFDEDEAILVEDETSEDQLDIANMPVFIKSEEGFLLSLEAASDGLQPAASSSESEDDNEWEQAHRLVEEAMIPLSSPAHSSTIDPVISDAVIPPEPSNSGNDPYRRPARKRPSVRGRKRLVKKKTDRRNEWTRGQPLQDVYVNDNDIPLELQEQIQQRLQSRTKTKKRKDINDVEEDVYFGFNEQFEWKSMDAWNGKKEKFKSKSGPTQKFTNAYDAMHAIWTDEIMDHIAHETNRYAQSLMSKRERFKKDWYDTNRDEIWILFAFWMMLGIIKMPTIKSCFTRVPLLETGIFKQLFNQNRYWCVNSAFHLASETNSNDPLNPMGRLLNHLNTKFKELYKLSQDICIDESLTLWKGPLAFKQYVKTKSAQYGIKSYQLCESSTGYLWSFFVYIGRETNSGSLSNGVSTVLRLIDPLLDLGHTLYMDNYFNSLSLARWLKKRKTDCVGTLRPFRKNVPDVIKLSPLKEGQFVARASDDVMVVALRDRNRLVTCLSTYHDASQVWKPAKPGLSAAQFKLKLIDDYNQAMGGVDRLDQMLEAYLLERKQCRKWNKKLFKKLLNVSIQNCRILVERSTNTKIEALAFRLALVQEIVDRHLKKVPHANSNRPRKQHPTFPMRRLTERHFIRRIPITDENRKKVKYKCNLGRRVCVWCTDKGRIRQKTSYECPNCNVPLCLEICFEEFHTKP